MKKTLRQLTIPEGQALLRSLDGATREASPVADVAFPEGMKWDFRKLEGVRVHDVDFDGPKVFGSVLRRLVIKECSFENVTLDGLAMWRTEFVDCKFEGANLGKRYRGLFKKTSFVGCSFIGCRVEGVTFDGSSFTRCRFEDSQLNDVGWDRCTLAEVEGSGNMKAVGFVRCGLRQVDFSAVTFSGCSLLDTDMANVTLPDNPRNFLVAPRLLLEVQGVLEIRLSADAFEQYLVLARILSQSRSDLLVDESLFQRVPQAERRVVMSALFEGRHRKL